MMISDDTILNDAGTEAHFYWKDCREKSRLHRQYLYDLTLRRRPTENNRPFRVELA